MILACNIDKLFLFSKFRKIKGVFVSIFVVTFVFFFFENIFQVEILGLIQAQGGIRTFTLPSVTGTWTVFLPVIFLTYNFWKHIWQYTNSISYAFLKHTYTLVSLLTMTDGTSTAILWSGLIIQLIVNVEVYVCMYYKNCLPWKILDIRFLH